MLILYIVIIILVILLLLTSMHLILLKKEIKNIDRQFVKIMNESTNARINKGYVNHDAEALIKTLNQYIDQTNRLARKSKESNDVLKSTILNMSHDIRTPLTSMQGYLQLIKMDEIDALKRKEYIGIMESRLDSLKSMMENFFELAKVESNSFPINLKILNAHEIFVEIIGMYYDLFQEKKIFLDLKLMNHMIVIADESALKRIFNNLVSNIVKYGKSKAQIKSYSKDNYIIFTFKNDTNDINDENVNKLFDKFYTVSNSRTEKSSGLGLAITKELVYKINGQISIDYKNEEITFILKLKQYMEH